MKKIYLALLLVAGALTSCDMNLQEPGVKPLEISTLQDCQQYVNGIYYNLRGVTGNAYIAYPEIQADMFEGTIINMNQVGLISAGNILSSDQDLESIYSGMYSVIGSVNFFIPRAEEFLATADLADDVKAEVKRSLAEAHFARAYYYYYLFDHYCQPYSDAIVDQPATGLCLVDEFAPTPDRDKYPGRSTMGKTIVFIQKDLTAAYDGLKEYEDNVSKEYCVPNAYRLSSYAVECLEARFALLIGDNQTAYDKANDVITCGNYALCPYADYVSMWENDESTELIFVPYGDQDEQGAIASTGFYWLYSRAKDEQALYVPSSALLSLYTDKDVRKKAFFDEFDLNVNGSYIPAPVFVKYPGNPALRLTAVNNLKNKPKPFRLSEMYLVAAEASVNLTDEGTANTLMRDLCKIRIKSYIPKTYTGDNLVNFIRTERCKELIGEGFRLSDLRRWELGFTRECNYATYNSAYADLPETLLIQSTKELSYLPGDYRYTWPIPLGELQVNPQLAGQQNPGY